MIKGILQSLPERGKIKIGKKGKLTPTKNNKTFRVPEKTDHFLITTLERDPETENFILDQEIHKKLGAEPKRIPILFLYDSIDLNFMTRYSSYAGRTCVCSGDGEKAQRMINKEGVLNEVGCPCPAADPAYVKRDKGDMPKCKMNGSLQCLIQDSEDLGGVHKFRTTSHNSVKGILSSLSFFKAITKGRLQGLPFDLVITPKTAEKPGGGAVKIYVVGIAFTGTFADIYKKANQLKLEDAKYGYNVKAIEDHAKKLLTFDNRDVNDIVEEFYPEQAKNTAPVVIPDEDVTVEDAESESASEIINPKSGGGQTSVDEKKKDPPPARQRRKRATSNPETKPETGTDKIANPEDTTELDENGFPKQKDNINQPSKPPETTEPDPEQEQEAPPDEQASQEAQEDLDGVF